MKVNVPRVVTTHEGGKAVEVNPLERLKRTVMACLLFEDNFYEDGMKCADRVTELCAKLSALQITNLALEASMKYKLRHMPLQLIVEALKHKQKGSWLSDAICVIITRPDQMTDLVALYWKQGRKPLAHQLKKGLAKAFRKFDEYQLSKYNRDNPIKLRDILFMCHAKPFNDEQDAIWKRLIKDELATADTWETRLSSGADKKESFQELLQSRKMGKLAILRNLRNMKEAGIDKKLVKDELNANIKEMLPFQYLAAARECPEWEDIIDMAMVKSAAAKPKLPGHTILLVDVSGSMDALLASKGTMTRMDAACGLAILLRECCEDIHIYTFSNSLAALPPRQGMALRDAIVQSQPHAGTCMGGALKCLQPNIISAMRVIVVTDEQTRDIIPPLLSKKNYILNIGPYENGVGSKNQWMTISGFSEASIDYIRMIEAE